MDGSLLPAGSRVVDLVRQRAAAYDAFAALANQDILTPAEQATYANKKQEVINLDAQITRVRVAQELLARDALPVAEQPGRIRVVPSLKERAYIEDDAANTLAKQRGFTPGSARSIVLGGMIQMLAAASGILTVARSIAVETYGETHPVTRALIVSDGTAGGFIVPPDYVNEIIELLRPMTVVRSSNPRVIPMPRGTMTLPGQGSPATATYGSETARIASSQPGLRQIVASFKKLTALTPVSNDMMRYADPAVDAFVRDDLVKVIALREDLAFLMGDGTQDAPRGFISFANGWVSQNGGTPGAWNVGANSVAAVNGPAGNPLLGMNGGNFITSTAAFNLASAGNELGGLINRLDSANVGDNRRVWMSHPRVKNYLFHVQNSLGVYVYRDELEDGMLFGYPYRTTTQIPVNISDTTNTNQDCSFLFLTQMDEAMILDSMSLELAVSREGTYVDGTGATVSAFQNDQTLIRAIAEHDFQMRHDSATAVLQFCRWAPSIQ